MYFDIDFDPLDEDYNAELCVYKFVDIFVKYCNIVHNLRCTKSDVVVLDSSNATKNSYHLIFKTVVFENNLSCKKFIQDVLNRLSLEEIEEISFFDSSGQSKYIVDLSVYQKNQNFRIMFSSKFGKNTQLKAVQSIAIASQKQIFFDSLVCDKNLVVNTKKYKENDYKRVSVSPKGMYVFDKDVFSSTPSKFPAIDHFVSKQIEHGQISKVQFYENAGTSKPMIIYRVKGRLRN